MSFGELERIADRIEAYLSKAQMKLYQEIGRLSTTGEEKLVERLHRISAEIWSSLREVREKKPVIEKFVNLVKRTRSMPEDIINLLSLTELPVTQGGGRVVVEGIVGYRGLGIETIDHHLSKVSYENVEEPRGEGAPTNVSITSLMYRVPPFELSKCEYEREKDEEVTRILGARHVWLVKPKGVTDNSWRNVLTKTLGRGNKDVIIGKYDPIGRILQLNTLKLVDVTRRSLELEIVDTSGRDRYVFFLKLGSSGLEEQLKGVMSKERVLEVLRERERQAPVELGPRGSWRIRLDYVYFCYKGLAMSTDPYDLECPYRNCPLRIGSMCDGERFWSAKYFRRKPYPKVYPLRSVDPGLGGIPSYREALPTGLITFSAYDKRRIESVWYGVEMGTWFIRARPTIRIYFDDSSKIGYSIPTSLLEFSFIMEWLDNEIKTILLENDEIRRSIALKYVLLKSLGRRLDYDRLARALTNIMSERGEEAEEFAKYYKRKEIDDDILSFARRLLLHSLTHMLTQYILYWLVGVDYNFILTRYYYKNSAKIFLVENAKNGRLGIVDTVVKHVKRKGLPAFLLEFTGWLDVFLDMHDKDFDKISAERKSEATRLIATTIRRLKVEDPGKADRLIKVDDIVRSFRDELENAGLELDIALARIVLLASNKVREDLIQDIEDYFDDVLEKNGFRLCWDGCNACVRLEKHCNEGIYQVLTTSKMLLQEFTKHLRSILSKGINDTSRSVGRILEPLLMGARSSLDISSPFISPRYARMLIEKSKEGVKVRVLTSAPPEGELEHHLEALEILKLSTSDSLEVRIVESLHAKIYIIDKKIAVTGSANLTESGLFRNLEHIEVKMEPKTVEENVKMFENLWANANPI
ncbi:phospholipase D-like domain-containing protein [Infirmifilum sp. SLHALR2]|nr:MAG: hypothetical protein B7L53_08305 [Thermofilum sp. NZ13]